MEHVGIGGDFNGVEEFPEGLQDVSQYPNVSSDFTINCVNILLMILITISINFQLFEALIDFGENWDDHSLALLAGGNLLRVLRQVFLDDDDDDDDGDDYDG